MFRIVWHVFLGFFLLAVIPVGVSMNEPTVVACVILGPIILAYAAYLIVKRLEAPNGE